MTPEQRFAKALYAAYKKSIVVNITFGKVVNIKYGENFKNSFWENLSKAEAQDIIENNPTLSYYPQLEKYLDSWFIIKAAGYILCSKELECNKDEIDYNTSDITKFLKECRV